MNRAERRRQLRQGDKPKAVWRTAFDAKPMANGMPPSFLLYLLNEKDGLARHGKLLTAALWLQSQMAALICLQESPELRERCTVENGRHLPNELLRATTAKLEDLSSESLKYAFIDHFGEGLPLDLKDDLEKVTLARDALAHGYLSLIPQIMGEGSIAWSPRPSRKRDEVLDRAAGPRPADSFFTLSLSDHSFDEEIARICRIMDFIASKVTEWDIPYPVFA